MVLLKGPKFQAKLPSRLVVFVQSIMSREKDRNTPLLYDKELKCIGYYSYNSYCKISQYSLH